MKSVLFSLFLSLVLSGVARAAVYQVGADQPYKTVQEVLSATTPVDGDVILVHPGVYPRFEVDKGGGDSPETAPVIRAYDPAHRPIFDAQAADNAITFRQPTGKWYAIDGLEVRNAGFRGVFNIECGLVMRHCYIHDCRNGFMGGMDNCRASTPGHLIAEYNEFARNGDGGYAHQLYVQEYSTIFRYNYVHDGTGGQAYKDRSRQSLLEYNLIEQGPANNYTVEFCGCGDSLPDHTQSATMIGNIVTKKRGDNRWVFLANTRSEGGSGKALNVGRLVLLNNTFFTEDHTGPMLCTDEGSVIAADNNIFQSTTSTKLVAPAAGAKGPGTFQASHQNWVNARLKEVPAEFEGTVRGDDPGFVRAAFHNGDFHLRPGSACIGTGWAGVGAPALEYAPPCAFVTREQKSRPDIGAYAGPRADGR